MYGISPGYLAEHRGCATLGNALPHNVYVVSIALKQGRMRRGAVNKSSSDVSNG
ncbi:MAG: hypothetical protein ACI93T_001545 [Porticoccaceae bacterium]|jgi:hypothetical protein